ncbi:MAG: FlgD immunoglobulin-like domain containing protein [Candidatus Kapaibacterium sp.]
MNSLRFAFFLFLLLASLSSTILSAQTGGTSGEPFEGEDSTDTIFVPDGIDVTGGNPTGSGSTESGSESPWVDSIFYNGKMIRFTVKLSDMIRRDSVRLRALIDSIERSTAAVIAANLRLDPSEWQPTAEDKMRREEMIAAAQDRDWIYPKDITRIPVASIPLSSIGQALGITEDISPRFSYTLLNTRQISVIIYTQSALAVKTLVNGTQKPGEYRLEWDFTDSNGRKALAGSYFVEVIADGKELLLRKRIVVP